MKNPNGYGGITKLSGNRRKPYMARKTTGFNDKGSATYQVIGYYATRPEAMMALAEYNKNPYDINAAKVTVKEIYDLWSETKFEDLKPKSKQNYECAFKHCTKIQDLAMQDIKAHHLEKVIDGLKKTHTSATINKVRSLFSQLFLYAMKNDVVDKNYAKLIDNTSIPSSTQRKPFTHEEIELLFKSTIPYADTILILIYTGFRVGELLDVKCTDINAEEWYIRGGAKTDAGKNRLVPINKKIQPFIKERLDLGNEYLISTPEGGKFNYANYRKHYFLKIMDTLGMKHTIHETRHTFATLLNNAEANQTSIIKLIGHSNFMTTEKIYSHKDINELRKAVDLI